MIDPIQAIGLANSAVNGVSKTVTEVINTKEQQRTLRQQNKLGAAVDFAQCFQQVALAYQEYKIIADEQHTKRREIEAWEMTTLKNIEKQRAVLLAFLDHSFAERANNFRELFVVVDKAVASGNNEQLGLVLDKIAELAKSSPFKDLADFASVQDALVNQHYEWKF